MPSFCHERRAVLCGLTGLAANFAVVAAWPTAAATADGDEAARLISELADKTIDIISDESLSRTARADRLRDVINRGFDTDAIGRFVLGRHWQSADAAQRKEFIRLFRDYTALSYARRFEAYAGQKLAITGTRDIGNENGNGHRVLVQSEIKNAEGGPVKIDWRLRHDAEGWRIYDVIVEGVSMVLTQRSEFASVIDRNGGKLQPLIDQIKDRMADLA